MITFGMGLVFAGYAVGSWGYVLVKGYNITFREWFSPLNPWSWPPPGQRVAMVPKGHLFPTAQGPAGAEGSGGPITGSSPVRHDTIA